MLKCQRDLFLETLFWAQERYVRMYLSQSVLLRSLEEDRGVWALSRGDEDPHIRADSVLWIIHECYWCPFIAHTSWPLLFSPPPVWYWLTSLNCMKEKRSMPSFVGLSARQILSFTDFWRHWLTLTLCTRRRSSSSSSRSKTRREIVHTFLCVL